MVKLTWDPLLEAIATHYVEKCTLGHNTHRHNEYIQALQITGVGGKQNATWIGENIAWGVGNCGNLEKYVDCGDIFQGMKRWYLEAQNYDIVHNRCTDQCSLYTQIVWANTYSIGCGAKVCEGNKTILVCNYYPGGNQLKKLPYVIGIKCSHCPKTHRCTDNLCEDSVLSSVTPLDQPSPLETSLSNDTKIVKLQDDRSTESSVIPDEWTALGVNCIDFDSCNNKELWCILPNYNLMVLNYSETGFHHRALFNKYNFTHVTVNGETVWAVDDNRHVIYKEIGNHSWSQVDSGDLIISKIQTISFFVVWILTTDYHLYYRSEISRENGAGLSWSSVEFDSDRGIEDLTCGDSSCWIISKGKVYIRLGISNATPQGTYWLSLNTSMTRIFSGYRGYTIAKLKNIFENMDDNELYFWRTGIDVEKSSMGSGWLLIKFPPCRMIYIGDHILIASQPNFKMIYKNSYPGEIYNHVEDTTKSVTTTSLPDRLSSENKTVSSKNDIDEKISLISKFLKMYDANQTPNYPTTEDVTYTSIITTITEATSQQSNFVFILKSY
ncbi:Glioma pathogenesis-related protein 1 [Thelohanellus kitauei]|uniref:Glioma pathogenesis-related protein 1 n=1 Tax=Thelohanellus kitauei TaxID=669202 RepID=A0A0C2N720_THEKT|nr:Glioma pathogenesis-related protein 1 [Thelohanellus kitauei]